MEKQASERRPSILVVDDDVDTCLNLADILEDRGYRVDITHEGPSALEMLDRRGYDVALLDLKMPGMDGLTLYREVKRRRAETVAMIVTAYAHSETAEEALQAGAWRILSKPVDVTRLLKLVGRAAEQPLVLVVDDDHDLCASLWDLFRERGFRVGLAHSEQEAARRLQDRSFRVVLIDMRLPEGDGSGVFRQVRDANPHAHSVLITGYRQEMDEAVQHALGEGAEAVCYKPFDVFKLLETVERLARGSAASP